MSVTTTAMSAARCSPASAIARRARVCSPAPGARRLRAPLIVAASAAPAEEAPAANERYMARGVSASKEDVHAAIANVDKGLFPKAFCKVVPDLLTGDEEYCTCMRRRRGHQVLARVHVLEGDRRSLRLAGIAQDAVIMNTDDLLCIGCVDNILLSSTIGRNKSLIPARCSRRSSPEPRTSSPP